MIVKMATLQLKPVTINQFVFVIGDAVGVRLYILYELVGDWFKDEG